MPRGGKRPGAGRKRGATNKLTRAQRMAAAKAGKLPHELALDIARGDALVPDIVAVKDSDGNTEHVEIERKPSLEERLKAIAIAAPFYAPKLSAVAPVTPPNPNDNPIKHLMEQVHSAASSRVAVGK